MLHTNNRRRVAHVRVRLCGRLSVGISAYSVPVGHLLRANAMP